MACVCHLAYVAYILVFIVGIPLLAWFVLLPAHSIPAFYWTAFILDCTINTLTIISGLFLLGSMIRGFRHRRKRVVWNQARREWQVRYDAGLQYILDACPTAFISDRAGTASLKAPRLGPPPVHVTIKIPAESGAECKEGELMLPRLLVVVPTELATDPTTLTNCLVSIGEARYTDNIEVVLVAQSPEPLTELPPHLADLSANYQTRYGRQLTILVDVAPVCSAPGGIQLALDHVSGEEKEKPDFTYIVKAHQRPDRNALLNGVWLATVHGADLVQGRAVVLNNRASLWTRIRSVSYDSDYVLQQDGHSIMRGLGFMGGTSSFWRTAALLALGLDAGLIHPNIDAGFRATLSGRKVVSSPELRTYEIVETSFRGWVSSHIRFSQGWFQLTLRHGWALLTSPYLSYWIRISFAALLFEREICSYVATQMLPISAASIVYYTYKRDVLLLGTTAVALSLRPLHLLLVRLYLRLDLDAEPPLAEYRPSDGWDMLLYLILYPFTAVLRFVISAAAHLRVLRE